MRIFQFIRNYYLYFYFHTTELKKQKNKDADPFIGYAAMTFFVMGFHAAALLYTFNAIGVEFITNAWREEIFNFRGSANLMVITTIGLSIVLTFFTCCYKIEYKMIEPRLKEITWFQKRSAIKLIMLPVLSFSILITCMNILY